MSGPVQQQIIPNLWFDTEAEEAAGFYTSVFKLCGRLDQLGRRGLPDHCVTAATIWRGT
jgi:hypothetical protein